MLTGWQIKINGVVQGVGFRPTVWRVAHELGAVGNVSNNASGVLINLSLPPQISLETFITRLKECCPPIARIDSIDITPSPPVSTQEFTIIESEETAQSRVTDVSPDVAICPRCMADVHAQGKRHRYWLTNCTLCGPRFTITRRLPYDRPHTTMQRFAMCDECMAEYTNPADRRFHAQPIACNHCGPAYTDTPEALARRLQQGEIIILKGAGGYNLLCDATNAATVEALRSLKHRRRKPFAVMVADTASAAEVASLSDAECRELQSWRNTIVIVDSKGMLPDSVAPGLTTIGIMLPGMAFQHALAASAGRPLVLTSANFPGSPIIKDDEEAERYARAFNLHLTSYNRDIVNRVDDSVVRIIDKKPRLLRQGRGYTPQPLQNVHKGVDGIIGMGADVASQWAFGRGSDIIPSQFIGHLHTEGGEEFLRESLENLSRLYRLKPQVVVTDRHPDYVSTSLGKELAAQHGARLLHVWHHHAHALAVMAEYKITEPTAALVLDGTGLGENGTIWGCELLEARTDGFSRLWHGPSLAMPGGDSAAKEPWRMAISLAEKLDLPLPHALANEIGQERCDVVKRMIKSGLNSPITTGAGRLWDAMSAWLGLTYFNGYEAEAPILLEGVASQWKGDLPREDSLQAILNDHNADTAARAARFHALFAEDCALAVQACGADRVILTGGVFQNRLFTHLLIQKLKTRGIKHLMPQTLPAGDGQIAVGQIYFAAHNA